MKMLSLFTHESPSLICNLDQAHQLKINILFKVVHQCLLTLMLL